MENQINSEHHETGQVSQPQRLQEKAKFNYWMIASIALLLILILVGIYIAGQTSSQQSSNSQSMKANPTLPASDKKAAVTWQTQTFPIEYEGRGIPGLRDHKVANLQIRVPFDWTTQKVPVNTDPVASVIKNCFILTIASKDQMIKVVFTPICGGWVSKNTPWPNDAVIALQQKRTGNDGSYDLYRIRTESSVNYFNYIDARIKPDQLIDKNKDTVRDALVVGYAPPNEGTDDFFFIAAHLEANYTGQPSAKDTYLSIVDQIAASITLSTANSTMTPAVVDPTVGWINYAIAATEPSLGYADYAVKIPASWKQVEHSSNFQGKETFVDAYSPTTYQLVIQQQKFYDEQTGKPYTTSIKDAVGIPYDLPSVVVDGQEGVRVLPRAGSETHFGAAFFSKDMKLLITIILDTPADESKFDEGEALFKNIISTFKFAALQ